MFTFKVTVIFFGAIVLVSALPVLNKNEKEWDSASGTQLKSDFETQKFNALDRRLREVLRGTSRTDGPALDSDFAISIQRNQDPKLVIFAMDPVYPSYFDLDNFETDGFRSKRGDRSYSYHPMRG